MSILDLFRLDGKVAIVTGAGRGIGAAIAKAYAEAGADVVLAARTLEQLEQTATVVRNCGRKALVVQTDVLVPEQLESLLQTTLATFERIDILVNNAGGWRPQAALKTSVEDFENCFRFNVSTAFAMTRLTVPEMINTAGSGAVINISSVAGVHPWPGFVAYGTAKSALSYLTRELAQDFAPKVRVNAIAVGSTKTEALETVLTPEITKAIVAMTPMARLGEVEDIAACALYLAAPASGYVSGEIVGVNGALTGLNMAMPRAFD